MMIREYSKENNTSVKSLFRISKQMRGLPSGENIKKITEKLNLN